MTISITNVLHEPVVLPEKLVAALFHPKITTGIVSTLETLQFGTPNISSQVALPNQCDMAAMVADCLEGSRREKLISPLYNFSDLFDVDGRPLGVA